MHPEAGGLRHPREGMSDRWLVEELLLDGWTPAVRQRAAKAIRSNAKSIVLFLALNMIALGGVTWYAARDAGINYGNGKTYSYGHQRGSTAIVKKKDGTVVRRR